MIFGERGVRWLHTGGIFAALSETTPDVIDEAMVTAKKYGTIISYDLNTGRPYGKPLGARKKHRK
jgi:2-dehydro-3-deoxygluconokinase